MLAGALAAERDRWIYWLPAAFGGGIALYFALPFEPSVALVAAIGAAALLTVLLAVLARRRAVLPVLLVGLALVGGGFALAAWRTHQVAAPMLDRETGPGIVEGRVIDLDLLEGGVPRALLDQVTIEDVPPERTPARVRVRLRDAEPPQVGARIAVLAILDGPSGPVLPGGFDFRRNAFFQQLGGIGFALRPSERLAEAEPGSVEIWLERLRQSLSGRIAAVLGTGDTAAIAIAFMTGERGAISDPVLDAMRDSGLTHLLSISGLHVGLLALLVYGALRLVLAAIEPVALRWPIKKWAALAGILAAFAYTGLVGLSVPTVRSFLMYAVAFAAILVDRAALSMRSVALAAMVVLAVAPESLLGPSFQMSFAAVAALIAGYEAAEGRIGAWRADAGWLRRALIYVAGLLLTSLLATLATAPFAIFHFQRLQSYGLLANLLAVPLTGAVIMPAGLAATLLMPFGLEWPALWVMGRGVDLLIAIAAWTAALPGAAWLIPAAPVWSLLAAVAGGLWLVLWRRVWRLAGLAGLALGAAGIVLAPAPDILVSADGRLMAVRGADGWLSLSAPRRDAFIRDIWLRAVAQRGPDDGVDLPVWPRGGRSADGSLACDARGCLYRRDGWLAALTADRAAAVEDCAAADVVVAAEPVWADCPGPALLVDFFDLWRHGAAAIRLDPAGPVLVTVADGVGRRPWTIDRER